MNDYLFERPDPGQEIFGRIIDGRGMKIQDFKHYVEVENMHTIIGFLKKDCGISFMYKVAVEEELKKEY